MPTAESLDRQDATDVKIRNALAVLVVVLAIPHVYHILDFIWLYFLRPSSVKRSLHGKAPFAIVTGSTDGIGKATAAELLTRGFNVILHGRNEAKMRRVVDELRASTVGRASTPDIRYFIADATENTHDWAMLVKPFMDLHITVVVHNVTGGEDVRDERIDGRTEEYLVGVAQATALFPLLLTRALLPTLRRATRSGPVEVLFVGSLAGEVPPACLPTYGASKAFLKTLTRGLDNDEALLGTPTRVHFTYLIVGNVHSAHHPTPSPPSMWVPTSPRFAWSLVESIGCRRRTITPYVAHAVRHWLLQMWGDRVADLVATRHVRMLAAEAAKAAKAK